MRPDALCPQTARQAAAATTKLTTRLSKGEKRNRKRLAEVGTVYDLAPVPRRTTDVMASDKISSAKTGAAKTGSDKTGSETTGQPPAPAPTAKN